MKWEDPVKITFCCCCFVELQFLPFVLLFESPLFSPIGGIAQFERSNSALIYSFQLHFSQVLYIHFLLFLFKHVALISLVREFVHSTFNFKKYSLSIINFTFAWLMHKQVSLSVALGGTMSNGLRFLNKVYDIFMFVSLKNLRWRFLIVSSNILFWTFTFLRVTAYFFPGHILLLISSSKKLKLTWHYNFFEWYYFQWLFKWLAVHFICYEWWSLPYDFIGF